MPISLSNNLLLAKYRTIQLLQKSIDEDVRCSDGLYFGEGPIDILFNDLLASTALTKATELMQYLTQKSLESDL